MVKEDDNLDEIRKLYPNMPDEELRIAQDNLKGYLDVLYRMAERLAREGKSIADLK